MIIGLTGGVGSGKSTVLGILNQKYKAHIIEADKVAHKLMSQGTSCYIKIIREFGKDVLKEDGTIDRIALSEIVFNDNEKLEILNGIVHPAVKEEIKSQIQNIQKEDSQAIIVIEAALLIESGYQDICDKFWYVHADYPMRKHRLMESRGYTEKKIEEIINNQLTDDEFRKICDYVIDNSKSLEHTLLQIEKILEF